MSPIHSPAALLIEAADGSRSPASLVINAAGGSLTGIAARLGVRHSTVSRWLAGIRRPRAGLEAAIAAETNDDIAATAMSLIGESVDDD